MDRGGHNKYSDGEFWIHLNLRWIFPALFGLVAIGPLILAYQCVLWFRDGRWTPIPFRDGLAVIGFTVPHGSWGGLDRIMQYVASAPLWIMILFAALSIELLFLGVAELISRKASEASSR
jgi:hypothetical protein